MYSPIDDFVTKIFQPKGRTTRTEMTYVIIVLYLMYVFLSYFTDILGDIVALSLILVLQIPMFIRRLHDASKSGYNLLWIFTIVGFFYVAHLLLKKSTPTENKHGLYTEIDPLSIKKVAIVLMILVLADIYINSVSARSYKQNYPLFLYSSIESVPMSNVSNVNLKEIYMDSDNIDVILGYSGINPPSSVVAGYMNLIHCQIISGTTNRYLEDTNAVITIALGDQIVHRIDKYTCKDYKHLDIR